MDRTTVSGTVGAGSIPAGGANYAKHCPTKVLRASLVRKTWGKCFAPYSAELAARCFFA